MTDRKFMQLSHGKKTTSTQEEPNRQSHSSLDKIEKSKFSNSMSFHNLEIQSSFQNKKNSNLVFSFSHE